MTGGCTACGVIYTAAIAAGLMMRQFTNWLGGLPTGNDLSLNLLASELTVAGPARMPSNCHFHQPTVSLGRLASPLGGPFFFLFFFPLFWRAVMTQAELDRAVSRATGESVGTIRRHGFSMKPLPDDFSDDETNILPLQIVDWDEQDALRRTAA